MNCAYGLVSSDVAQDYSVALSLPMPAPVERVNAVAMPLLADARRKLESAGFGAADLDFRWSFDLRYRRQVHQITTSYGDAMPVTAERLSRLTDSFEALYERRYGKGSAYRHAGIEITAIRLKALGRLARPTIDPEPLGASDPAPAFIAKRRIYADAPDAMVEAPVYDFARLQPGMRCVLPVQLTNQGPLGVRISTVLLPFMGTRGGAAVQVKQVGHAVRQGDDIDGHYRIDRSLAPGDRMTLNVVFVIRKGGCTDRGPTWVERFPQVGVRALGIGSTVAATDAIAFQGTAASTCSD